MSDWWKRFSTGNAEANPPSDPLSVRDLHAQTRDHRSSRVNQVEVDNHLITEPRTVTQSNSDLEQSQGESSTSSTPAANVDFAPGSIINNQRSVFEDPAASSEKRSSYYTRLASDFLLPTVTPESNPITTTATARTSHGSTPPRQIDRMLPRRSLLAPNDDISSNSRSEAEIQNLRKTLDMEEMLHAPPKRAVSRVMSELRPVSGPSPEQEVRNEYDTVGAPAGVAQFPTPIQSRMRGSLRASADTFASKQVRLQNAWLPDLWTYMKNNHPALAICMANPRHPYKKRDRVLVLTLALLLTLLCSGIFATQECCTMIPETTVAVTDRRLAVERGERVIATEAIRYLTDHEPSDAITCVPFNGTCGLETTLCTQGSTCKNVPERNHAICLPNEPDQEPHCTSSGSCPSGWTCIEPTQTCRPTSTLVCYLGTREQTAYYNPTTYVSFAAGDSTSSEEEAASNELTAVSVVFGILKQIADEENSTSSSSSADGSLSGSEETILPSNSSSGDKSSESASGTNDGSSKSSSSKESSVSSSDTEQVTMELSLTKPANGAVYGISASVPVEWQLLTVSDTKGVPVDRFRVDFSKDGENFTTIASDIHSHTENSSGGQLIQNYRYNWPLDQNTSYICNECVLRICADVDKQETSICMRSDGRQEESSSSGTSTNTTNFAATAAKGITFQIVREIIECSCGSAHTRFVANAFVIALGLSLCILVLEQLVTFYHDTKAGGLLARRNGPVLPFCCGYEGAKTTQRGRYVIIFLLTIVAVACGFIGAKVTKANFATQTNEIIVLWLITFLIALAIGLIIFSTVLYTAIFTVRWRCPRPTRQEGGPLSDFSLAFIRHSVELESPGVSYAI